MNDKLLDTLFVRRKEAVTRLAFCFLISALMAIASRIPDLFVSLPATWISGGLSIAFLWVLGPPVLLVLEAYAIHGLSETEQLRNLLRSQLSMDADATPAVSKQIGEELTPIWRKSFPPIVHIALALVLLAPVISSGILFSSYLQLVRPENKDKTRTSQVIDAFLGTGGWKGFLPIAPSLQANLRNLPAGTKDDEKLKYERLANEVPWTYFPFQTWLYLLLLVLSLDGAVVGGGYMTGSKAQEHSLLYMAWHKLSGRLRRI
jgi:hypothetical protein